MNRFFEAPTLRVGGFREWRIEPQLFHAMPSQRFVEVEYWFIRFDRRDVIGKHESGTGCI